MSRTLVRSITIRKSVNKTNLIKKAGNFDKVRTLKTKEEIKLKFFK